jgi:signal transduction histidine kinase
VHRSRLAMKQQQLQHQLAYTQTLEQEVQLRTAQTERQQQQILEMTQQKLHLITAANHDLKHLAALIQLNAQSLALPTQYQQRLEWKSILSSSQMLGQLVSDLVELSSLDAGQVHPKLSALDLSALLDQLCQQFQPRFTAKQMLLTKDYPPAVAVLSDKALLSRLLMNLIDNAVQNLSALQQLRLSIEQRDEQCILTLEDTGPGLPQRIYQQWGAPFQRGTDNYLGHGLGLSIVRKITEVLQLPTELHSSPSGTCFRFRFQSAPDVIKPQGKKALILDPDPISSTQLKQQLQLMNIDVATNTHLQPSQTKVDWLFIDACLLYPLPETDRATQLAACQASNIVLMSANQADRQLAAQAQYFLLKPLKASRLAWLFA